MNFDLHWYPSSDGFVYCCAFDENGDVRQYRRHPSWGTNYCQVWQDERWLAWLSPPITKRRNDEGRGINPGLRPATRNQKRESTRRNHHHRTPLDRRSQ